MAKRILLALCALFLCFSLPLTGLAVTGCIVEDDEAVTLFATGEWSTRSEKWLVSNFPKLRSIETTQTRFVFASAPEVAKTRAVLNKKGESLTLYRFKTDKDVQKCKGMIKGNTLVYGGKTVYVDTLFPTTYYFNDAEKAIVLYCGADEKVNNKLSGYSIAGNFGAYFQSRNTIAFGDSIYLDVVKWDEGYIEPDSIKKVLRLTDIVCIGKIKKAPTIPAKGEEPGFGTYEIEITRAIKGKVEKTINIIESPSVMIEGRSYVLFLEKYQSPDGVITLDLAEGHYRSTFEINDKGYVLPIREYGMKAPVELEKFLKSI